MQSPSAPVIAPSEQSSGGRALGRHLALAALSGLAIFITYRWGVSLLLGGRTTVVIKEGDLSVVSSVLVVGTCLAWIAFRTAEAVGIVAEMVTSARARRAKQRRWTAHVARTRALVNAHCEIRTGSAPARPDAVANRAA